MQTDPFDWQNNLKMERDSKSNKRKNMNLEKLDAKTEALLLETTQKKIKRAKKESKKQEKNEKAFQTMIQKCKEADLIVSIDASASSPVWTLWKKPLNLTDSWVQSLSTLLRPKLKSKTKIVDLILHYLPILYHQLETHCWAHRKYQIPNDSSFLISKPLVYKPLNTLYKKETKGSRVTPDSKESKKKKTPPKNEDRKMGERSSTPRFHHTIHFKPSLIEKDEKKRYKSISKAIIASIQNRIKSSTPSGTRCKVFCMLEGYSMDSAPTKAANVLFELGGVIRSDLYEQKYEIGTLSPKEIKMYFTGDGEASKLKIHKTMHAFYPTLKLKSRIPATWISDSQKVPHPIEGINDSLALHWTIVQFLFSF